MYICNVPIFYFLLETIYIYNVTLHWRQGKGEQCKCPDFLNVSGHFESPHKTSRSVFPGENCRWWWVAGGACKLNSPLATSREGAEGREKVLVRLWVSGCHSPAITPCGSWQPVRWSCWEKTASACQRGDHQFSFNNSVTFSSLRNSWE